MPDEICLTLLSDEICLTLLSDEICFRIKMTYIYFNVKSECHRSLRFLLIKYDLSALFVAVC